MKRIETLHHKTNKLLGLKKQYEKSLEIEGINVLFVKSNNEIEFHTNVEGEKIILKGADGNKREYILDKRTLLEATYTKEPYKLYIIDEKNKVSIPHQPYVEVDELDRGVGQAAQYSNKWKSKSELASGEKWFKILAGIGVAIGLIVGVPMGLILLDGIAQSLFGVSLGLNNIVKEVLQTQSINGTAAPIIMLLTKRRKK